MGFPWSNKVTGAARFGTRRRYSMVAGNLAYHFLFSVMKVFMPGTAFSTQRRHPILVDPHLWVQTRDTAPRRGLIDTPDAGSSKPWGFRIP